MALQLRGTAFDSDFKTNTSESLSTRYVTNDLNVPYVRDEIKRLSQRYDSRQDEETF